LANDRKLWFNITLVQTNSPPPLWEKLKLEFKLNIFSLPRLPPNENSFRAQQKKEK
jgi:hypothetical protein